MGKEGNNYWVSRAGRCRLTAPEHLRPSGPDETGEFLAMSNVKRELEQLLNNDFDEKDGHTSEEEDEVGGLDDIGTLYAPSENPGEDEDMGRDHAAKRGAIDRDNHDEEGDVIFDPEDGDPEEKHEAVLDKNADET